MAKDGFKNPGAGTVKKPAAENNQKHIEHNKNKSKHVLKEIEISHTRPFASSKQIVVATMKKSVNNCIGYIGQTPKSRDVRKSENPHL